MYTCEICRFSFTRKDSLKRHKVAKHKNDHKPKQSRAKASDAVNSLKKYEYVPRPQYRIHPFENMHIESESLGEKTCNNVKHPSSLDTQSVKSSASEKLIVLRSYAHVEPRYYANFTFECLPYNDDTLGRVREYVTLSNDYDCNDGYHCDFKIISGSDALFKGYIDGIKSAAEMINIYRDQVDIKIYEIGDTLPAKLQDDSLYKYRSL